MLVLDFETPIYDGVMTDKTLVPPFVDAEWCDRNRGTFSLADTRWYLDGSSGREAYDSGHLPGAVFVDLDRWLSTSASKEAGRNPLPAPEVFAQGMRELGINDSDTVIAYDDAGGVIAARLVWMLRATGHAAAVLEGGIRGYDGEPETTTPEMGAGDFRVRPWPEEMFADINEASSDQNQVVDARNRDRYEGRQDPVDPRPGHIPGAANVPCRENLDSAGKLLPAERLEENFRRAGITSADKVISYCGSGVTACHNLLVLEWLGLGHGRLFVGGWSQYAQATDRPVEMVPAT
jgi:thiosulfate/3-mercaptopyruvate sulfurtransferase